MSFSPPRAQADLWDIGSKTIAELATEQGILASGREEIYGCIFGRDSLISAMNLLRVYDATRYPFYLNLVRTILINLVELQGRVINIESGEEPGKCIHEYRPSNHEHLTKRTSDAWYVYPDNIMRNYDSVDSTPLLLIAIWRYLQANPTAADTQTLMPHVYRALDWVLAFGDSNADGFIDYERPAARKSGGLVTQSWMDSRESVFHEDGHSVAFPLSPVEVQAYAYLALKMWAHFFTGHHGEDYGKFLDWRAERLKYAFNQKFLMTAHGQTFYAAALDGRGRQLRSIRSTVGHCLWASAQLERWKFPTCIIDARNIPSVVHRLLQPDMFESAAGIRTLSTASSQFAVHSYHNGSIWPHDNSFIAEGFARFGYVRESRQVCQAMLTAVRHFHTPIEMFAYDGSFIEYSSPTGHHACRKQAWTAAAVLGEISGLGRSFPFSATQFHTSVASTAQKWSRQRE